MQSKEHSFLPCFAVDADRGHSGAGKLELLAALSCQPPVQHRDPGPRLVYLYELK